jgi:hypothetical protein
MKIDIPSFVKKVKMVKRLKQETRRHTQFSELISIYFFPSKVEK